jgi:hypothetical protein
VNATNTSFVGSITTDLKLSMSTGIIAAGGGGLILDLTPDLAVTLRRYVSVHRSNDMCIHTKRPRHLIRGLLRMSQGQSRRSRTI